MAYQKQEWIDRVIDPAQIDPETGKPKVVQEGTRFTSTRANHFEKGIADAHNLVESLAKEWGGNFVAAPSGLAGLQFSSSGLTAYWTAGVGYVAGRRFDVQAGNITLNATQGQYIYLDTDGVMKKTTSQATAEAGLLLWYFATDASQVITSTDKRNILNLDAMTIDPTLAPTGNTGRIRNLLSGLANMIKKITGKVNWWDAPRISLEKAANREGDTMTGGHVFVADGPAANNSLVVQASSVVARQGGLHITNTNAFAAGIAGNKGFKIIAQGTGSGNPLLHMGWVDAATPNDMPSSLFIDSNHNLTVPGILTVWKQSRARATSTGQQNIAALTYTKVALNNEVYDTQDEYDAPNSAYTSKTGGLYVISAGITTNSIPTGTKLALIVYINGVNYTNLKNDIDNTGGDSSHSGCLTISLNPNDKVEIYVYGTQAFSLNFARVEISKVA